MDYAERLLAWFDVNKREMPWRNTTDPYGIWVSEIMLQQTQVDTVIPYYEKFMKRFPTIHSLACATLEEVHIYWQGLGYYRRAQNLHKGAQMVDKECGGVFPTDTELVKKIPGIGPYTLGAILSIAFHRPIPAVDGNVMRILARQFLIEEDISVAKNRKVFDEKVMELMPEDPNRFNQALMELGALVCTPRSPKCSECPVNALCKGYLGDTAEQYPIKSQKVKVIPIQYLVLIIKERDAYWMEKRPEEGLLAGLWGFPLVEKKIFSEKVSSKLDYRAFPKVYHTFTHRKWELEPLLIEDNQNRLLDKIITEDSGGKFITLEEMKNYPIATAFKKVVDIIKKHK